MNENANLHAKKSLGQNFLKSEKALNKIIEVADLKADEIVLEIGPGKGALTEKLLGKGAVVVAVEKDKRMFDFLTEKFSQDLGKKIFLINQDILNFDLEKFLKKTFTKAGQNPDVRYKLIANIPYYITGMIIRKFLENQNQPQKMVLLVQKEVAERIVAKNKKESVLSVSVKAYCSPKYVETVRAGSFVPVPAVDSAILLFNDISKKNFIENDIDEKFFFKILNAGFAHKRKMLLSNLKEWQKNLEKKQFKKINFEKVFEKLKLDPKTRAEKISPEKWFRIVGEV